MGCIARFDQLSNVNTALGQLRRIGFAEGTPAFDALWKERGAIMAKLGRARPKMTLNLGQLLGKSPGIFRAWFDTETEWMIEARRDAWADPVYHAVPFELAQKVLEDTLTEAEEEFLFVAPAYVGEV